jgi:hypothetical protein
MRPRFPASPRRRHLRYQAMLSGLRFRRRRSIRNSSMALATVTSVVVSSTGNTTLRTHGYGAGMMPKSGSGDGRREGASEGQEVKRHSGSGRGSVLGREIGGEHGRRQMFEPLDFQSPQDRHGKAPVSPNVPAVSYYGPRPNNRTTDDTTAPRSSAGTSGAPPHSGKQRMPCHRRLQVSGCHVQVDRRGIKARVPKQLLYLQDVASAALEQQSRR